MSNVDCYNRIYNFVFIHRCRLSSESSSACSAIGVLIESACRSWTVLRVKKYIYTGRRKRSWLGEETSEMSWECSYPMMRVSVEGKHWCQNDDLSIFPSSSSSPLMGPGQVEGNLLLPGRWWLPVLCRCWEAAALPGLDATSGCPCSSWNNGKLFRSCMHRAPPAFFSPLARRVVVSLCHTHPSGPARPEMFSLHPRR
jgi:hypothetical protein